MGYDLHITRAEDWFENQGFEITPEEWLALVEADPELELTDSNGPYFTIWKGHPTYPEDCWFDWCEGNINTKNPDEPAIDKMVAIAQKLKAKVQGDDGEQYLGGGKFIRGEPSCPPDLPKPSILFDLAIFLGVCTLLGLIVLGIGYGLYRFLVWIF